MSGEEILLCAIVQRMRHEYWIRHGGEGSIAIQSSKNAGYADRGCIWVKTG